MLSTRRITQRFTRESHIPRAFENEFSLEVLESDRLRVTILMGAATAGILFQLIFAVAYFNQFQEVFHGNFRTFQLCTLGLFGFVIGSLAAERAAINYLIRNQKKAPEFLQYLSAFIETSIPTVGMIIGALFLGPVYTLFTPAAFTYPLLIALSALRLNFRLCIFTGAVAGLEYGAFALACLYQPMTSEVEPVLSGMPVHLFKAFLLFATGVVTAFVTLQIKRRSLKSFEVVEERNRISRTFGEYVSPAVMDKLLTLKPDLRSEKKHVCVMFLDIRNFTSFAETKSPEEVVDYLESLFGFMIEIVNRHHGIINKFLGDGFMAVFGAPLSQGRDCSNAVAAAKEILSRLSEEVESGRVLPTTVGIGLHAGEALTGSLGSSLRREYTVIGDVVNLASRIEQLNKQFNAQFLISGAVWETIQDELEAAIPIGDVRVKGRESLIPVYKLA